MGEIEKFSGAMADVAALNSGQSSVFSTFQGDDFGTKAAVLNAVTNAEPIGDHLGETIRLANIVAQATRMENEAGEEIDAVRSILVTDTGEAYAAVSEGIFKSLQNIMGILGHPSTWPEPVPVQVVEVKGRKGYKFYTVRLALD